GPGLPKLLPFPFFIGLLKLLGKLLIPRVFGHPAGRAVFGHVFLDDPLPVSFEVRAQNVGGQEFLQVLDPGTRLRHRHSPRLNSQFQIRRRKPASSSALPARACFSRRSTSSTCSACSCVKAPERTRCSMFCSIRRIASSTSPPTVSRNNVASSTGSNT